MLIKTSTYPFGPANKLPDDTIVQRVQFNGRFIDAYKGELIEGDEYYAPYKKGSVNLVQYMEGERLSISYEYDIDNILIRARILRDGAYEVFDTSQGGAGLHKGWLTEALLYLRDQKDNG
jgi:hypothetical protein